VNLPFRSLLILTLLAAGLRLGAAERIPAAPERFFNDYAGIVSASTASSLNEQLAQFERTTSNQVLVVIYPRMESDSSVEDYTVRVAQSWQVGQKARSNGAVLFAFMQEHKVYLQVGYGLEPVLTDATARRIIEQEIVPRFRQRDFDGGMRAAVTAILAATRGEYRGTGRTAAESHDSGRFLAFAPFLLMLGLILFAVLRQHFLSPGLVLGGPRQRGFRSAAGLWMLGGSGGGWNSGGGSSNWGSGGGSGFSGGGGSFGGGGAGGSW